MLPSPPRCPQWSLVDIAFNLTDQMYQGVYNGRLYHAPDVEAVLRRATSCGVRGLLLTGGNLSESKAVIEMCARYSTDKLRCCCTVGCHPTRCGEFLTDPEGYLAALDELISTNSIHNGGCVAAVGEIGLDYDRLSFCPKNVQQEYFEKQLKMALRHRLPLFLHDRNTGGDLMTGLAPYLADISRSGGVVHSFTGTARELQQYLDAGLFIGVNGCSLKTTEALDVVMNIPQDRLLLETDAPWCELKNTHASQQVLLAAAQRSPAHRCFSQEVLSAFPVCRKDKFVEGGMVKGRQEPCCILQVLEVLYELHREEIPSLEELATRIQRNTHRIFPCFS